MTDISMFARRTVIVASQNRGKLAELRQLFHDLPIDLVAMSVATASPIEIIEDGATFEENARKKARVVAGAVAMPTLADDSGLEVDLLGGRPGVRSARYAGDHATDAENNRKLLAELDAIDPGGPRNARFRCVLVLVDPVHPTRTMEASGACEGTIAAGPRGQGGFGYDPIFLVRDVPGNRTMAELTEDEKNVVSHRAKAAQAMRDVITAWLAL
jgi:XTP/dITP diphosphohydrolase